MSPSWNDRLLIALRPDKIVLLRVARGWRPMIKAKAVIPCAPNEQSPRWKVAVDMLAETLQQKDWRYARIDIVLSQHFVRVALVPASLRLNSKEEEDAFARLCLTRANGELTGEWRLCFSDGPPNIPKVVCATESGLLDALDSVVAGSGDRLASVRPFFAAAFDSRRNILSKQHAWFVTLESDRCCLLRLKHGIFQGISSRRIFTSLESELPAFLEHEHLLDETGDMPKKVFLVAPENPLLVFRPNSPWLVNSLPTLFSGGLSPQSDSAYGLAMEAAA